MFYVLLKKHTLEFTYQPLSFHYHFPEERLAPKLVFRIREIFEDFKRLFCWSKKNIAELIIYSWKNAAFLVGTQNTLTISFAEG